MTRSQLFFSLTTGTTLLLGGALLASAGIIDWGLFWAGGVICAVAAGSWLGHRRRATPAKITSPPRLRDDAWG
jgi:uncharacterized membrane protein YfcA